MDALSLVIRAGQLATIEGPSGSGKTTLLLLAGGLLAPTGGTVAFQGRSVYALSAEGRARWRAQHVGFVFQQFHLIGYLSVLDNVLAPTLARRLAEAPRRAMELLDRLGLAGRARHVPAELSTGEQQRTALARALLPQPSLLLCDEPTGNLDAESAQLVIDFLVDFSRQGGAVLLVTHQAEAAAQATRRLRLQSGRLTAGGNAG